MTKAVEVFACMDGPRLEERWEPRDIGGKYATTWLQLCVAAAMSRVFLEGEACRVPWLFSPTRNVSSLSIYLACTVWRLAPSSKSVYVQHPLPQSLEPSLILCCYIYNCLTCRPNKRRSSEQPAQSQQQRNSRPRWPSARSQTLNRRSTSQNACSTSRSTQRKPPA